MPELHEYMIGNEVLAASSYQSPSDPARGADGVDRMAVITRRETQPDGPTSLTKAAPFMHRLATGEIINTFYRGPLDIDNLTCETWEMRQQYRSLMLKEPAVKAALFSKIQAVANLDPQVIPDSANRPADKAAAKYLDWCITNSCGGWPKLIESICTAALIDGFSVGEKVFKLADSSLYPGFIALDKLYSCDTQYVRFDLDRFKDVSRVRMVRTSPGTSYDARDFLIFQHLQLFNSPFGISDLRAAYRAANLIEAAIKLRAIMLENFSGPFLVGKYKAGDPAVRAQMEAVLQEARALGFVVIPEGSEVTVMNLATSSVEQFQTTIEDLRKEIYTAIRGAYLPFVEGSKGSERGDTSVQKSITEIFETALAISVCEVINSQLVPDLITPNFGTLAGKPRVQLGGQNLDKVNKQLDVIERVGKMGIKTSKKQVLDLTRVEEATDPADYIVSAEQQQQLAAGPGGPGGPPQLGAGPGAPPAGPDGSPVAPPQFDPAGGGQPGTTDHEPGSAFDPKGDPAVRRFSDASESNPELYELAAGWPPAGSEGDRLAAILEPCVNNTARIFVETTKGSLNRALPNYATTALWSEDERNAVIESLTTLMVMGDLLARARLRQHLTPDGVRRFADADPKAVNNTSGDDAFGFIKRPLKSFGGTGPVRAIEYITSLVPMPGVSDAMVFADGYRRKAFTIAIHAEANILESIKESIVGELVTGRDSTTIINDVLGKAGLKPSNPQYGQMVARTNVMDAYDEGFHNEMQNAEVQADFPVWYYSGILDGREGDDHRPNFGTYHPATVDFRLVRGPRVYNCRCKPIPVYKRRWAKLQAEGKEIATLPASQMFADLASRSPFHYPYRVATLVRAAADLADDYDSATLARILGHLADNPRAYAAAIGLPEASRRFDDGKYDESLHPRNDHGQWINKGDIAAARTDPAKAAHLRSQTTNPAQRAKLDTLLDSKSLAPAGGKGNAKTAAAKARTGQAGPADHRELLAGHAGSGDLRDARNQIEKDPAHSTPAAVDAAGKIGDHVRDTVAGKLPMPPHPVHAKMHEALGETPHISDDQKKQYGEALGKVLGAMPTAALDRIDANLKGIGFQANVAKVGEAAIGAAKDDAYVHPRTNDAIDRAAMAIKAGKIRPAGAYLPKTGEVFIDGDKSEGYPTHEVYAHILGHVMNGPGKEFSNGADWQAAWRDEIAVKPGQTPNLNRYGGTSASEGMAEFSRLLYSGKADHATIMQRFPKASAAFQKAGLWPEKAPETSGEQGKSAGSENKPVSTGADEKPLEKAGDHEKSAPPEFPGGEHVDGHPDNWTPQTPLTAPMAGMDTGGPILSELFGERVSLDGQADGSHIDAIAPKNRADGTPTETTPEHVYTVPTASLHVDPVRFQYKVAGDAERKSETKKPKAETKSLLGDMEAPPDEPKAAPVAAPAQSAVYDNVGLPYVRNTKMPAVDQLTADHLPKIERRIADIPDELDDMEARLDEASDPFKKAGIRQTIEKLHSERDALEDAQSRLRIDTPTPGATPAPAKELSPDEVQAKADAESPLVIKTLDGRTLPGPKTPESAGSSANDGNDIPTENDDYEKVVDLGKDPLHNPGGNGADILRGIRKDADEYGATMDARVGQALTPEQRKQYAEIYFQNQLEESLSGYAKRNNIRTDSDHFYRVKHLGKTDPAAMLGIINAKDPFLALAEHENASKAAAATPESRNSQNSGKTDLTPETKGATPELGGESGNLPHVNLANDLAEMLSSGKPIDTKVLAAAANKAYGGTKAQGKFGPSDATDALEAGFNKSLMGQTDPTQGLEGAVADVNRLEGKVLALPTQTARSGNKISHQQFSTPPHYSYAAAWLANLTPKDVVLEPSAGTGCLSVQCANAGAHVINNELDPKRADFLKELFGSENVHVEDAAQISGILPMRGVGAPSAVVMNPPFSQTAGRLGDKKQIMTGANHIAEAMQTLAPNGRLVAIVGEGMQPTSKAYAAWFSKMKSMYNLRANVGVSGDEYKKYGTHFGTRMLVFDKTGPHTGETITGDAENIPHLMAMLEGVRNDRPQSTPGASTKPVRGGMSAGNASANGVSAAGVDAGNPLASNGQASGNPVAEDARGDAGALGNGSGIGSSGRAGPADAGLRNANGGGGGSQGLASPAATADGANGRTAPGTPTNKNGKGSRKRSSAKSLSLSSTHVPELRPAERIQVRSASESEEHAHNANARMVDAASADGEQSPGDNMYEAYRPSRLRIEGSRPHITKLVEPAALAAVKPPHPTYQPMLSPDIVAGGKFVTQTNADGTVSKREIGLSEAGLEGVQSAGQAHQHYLPGPEGQPDRRCGHFIGDGTGTGKGREASGIIADNWNQGQKKHVWVSEKNKLFNDAKRDWADLGMDPDKLIHFNDLKKAAFTHNEAVVFIPYSLLRSGPKDKTKSRNVDDLIKWLGPDHAGAIVFDEAHNMGNASDTEGERGTVKASKQAIAALKLERAVPNAHISFFSATGATELENLSYLDRLGIWGRGTAFVTKEDFLNKMQSGGMAALEAVSQSLKARGLYLSRSLSFEGVNYNKIAHKLTPEDIYTYNAGAEGWRTVLQHIDKVIEHLSGGEPEKASGERSNAMSLFWGSQQRFFNQTMTSLQTPTIIKAMEKDIAEGRSPVVSLFNTMEASTKRAISSKGEDQEYEELDVGPARILTDYINTGFPVHKLQEVQDEKGNISMETVMAQKHDDNGNPMLDHDGKPLMVPVEDPVAVEMRNKLLTMANELKMQQSPLDMVLNHFGHENVAECTGRTVRMVNRLDEQTGEMRTVPESRDSQKANEAEAQAFQGGKKKVLIFSAAGGTGASYHADRAAVNQNQRSHYMLQLAWRADTNVQAMGRTHRTNQVSAPIINLAEIPEIPGQRRFVSTTMRRLAQLGALTQGQAKSAGGGDLFTRKDNLESKEAQAGLDSFLHALKHGQVDGLDFNDTMTSLGLMKPEPEAGSKPKRPRRGSAKDEGIEMRQFLNRIMVLDIDHQQKVFDAMDQYVEHSYHKAEENGTLDSGVENFPGATRVDRLGEEVVNREPNSGAEAKLITTNVHRTNKKLHWDTVQAQTKNPPLGYYRNTRTGKIWAAYKGATMTDTKTGNVIPQTMLKGPTGSPQIIPSTRLDNYNHRDGEGYTMLSFNDAKAQWQKQHDEAPAVIEGKEYFVTGDLLGVWDKLPDTKQKIYRLKLSSGENIVGRHIPAGSIDHIRTRLGASAGPADQHEPADVFRRIQNGSTEATLGNGWRIKRSLVGYEQRIELVGPKGLHKAELKGDGVDVVNMQSVDRYFLPNTDDGAAVLQRILKHRNERIVKVGR